MPIIDHRPWQIAHTRFRCCRITSYLCLPGNKFKYTMESSGAKKYTVADDRKQRSSVLLDKFTERKLSWIKAMEKANTTLEQERQDANENNSKNQYFGYSKSSKRKMQVALAPSCCDQLLQTSFYILFTICCFCAFYFLDFGLLFSFGMGLFSINLYVKTITTGNNFQNDDCAPFQILRMMDENDRSELLKKVDSGLFSDYTYLLPIITMPWLAGTVGIYVLLFNSPSLTLIGHIAFHVFFVLFQVLPKLPVFPIGLGVESGYFYHVTKAFTKMINEDFVIWEVEGSDGKASFDMANNTNVDLENGDSRRRVNFEQAYENFHVLIELVEQYSSCFAGYFFYAEFTLLLATVFLGVGTGDNIFKLIRDGFTLLGIFRVMSSSMLFLLYVIICKIVFSAAASITKAISNLKHRAHKLDAIISVIDPSSMDKSKKFYDHVCEGIKLSGFRSMGIIISNSLGAKLGYGALTLLSTVVMVAMKYVEL